MRRDLFISTDPTDVLSLVLPCLDTVVFNHLSPECRERKFQEQIFFFGDSGLPSVCVSLFIHVRFCVDIRIKTVLSCRYRVYSPVIRNTSWTGRYKPGYKDRRQMQTK